MDSRRTVMLLDSAGMYFRAFYGVPDSVRAPDGMPVNAVRGFCDMLSTLLQRYRPTDLVACLDNDWRPAFRVALLPSYKAHRVATEDPGAEEVPDLLTPQVPVLLAVLKAFGIAAVGADGFEADDVIATLAERHGQAGTAVDVVSGDRDLIGVVSSQVRLLYIGRGVAKLEELDPAAVLAKYGIEAGFYPDFAVLRGDPSDGLPGVAGIGEKTGASLVTRFGAIEQILAAAKDSSSHMTAGERAKVLAAQDYLAVAPAVVRGRIDVPLPDLDPTLPETPADPEMLDALADQFGLHSPISRLRKALV
jgi:5'-3' exonuclease